jgi:hypothetical protein
MDGHVEFMKESKLFPIVHGANARLTASIDPIYRESLCGRAGFQPHAPDSSLEIRRLRSPRRENREPHREPFENQRSTW